MGIDIQQELWILVKFPVVEGMSGAEIHCHNCQFIIISVKLPSFCVASLQFT